MNRNKQLLKYIVSDFIAASLVWILFNIHRFTEVASYIGYSSLSSYLTSPVVLEGQILLPVFWIILYYFSGYYNKTFGKSRLNELFLTLVSVVVGVVFIFFVMILNDLPRSFHIYYELFFSLLGLQFFFTYIPRLIITQTALNKVKHREWMQNVLVVGTGVKAAAIAKDLYNFGYNIIGFVRDDQATDIRVDQDAVIGSLDQLPDIMNVHTIHELVVSIESTDNERLSHILYSLYKYKLPIKVLADKSTLLSNFKIKTILGTPLVDVTDNNFSDFEKNIKFVADKVLSALALILLSPVFLYIYWRVKKDSPGPVLFKQERVGYMGKPFMIFKFRTMYTDSEDNGPLLSSENDERVTPFGRFMRKYRLDELPQFWNVIKGDMSLVGPRPERKYFIDQIVKKAPYFYLLHNVRPGITSLGMVKYGYAGNVDEMVERLEYDMLYYENMSLTLDIIILIYTVRTVVTGKGI